MSERLPFWHFDEKLMVYSDGSLGTGFRLSGIDIATASNDFVNEFSNSLENLLNSADAGLKFQIFYKLTPNVGSILDEHSKITANDSREYEAIAKSRTSFLGKNWKDGVYFQPEIYFFIRSEAHRYRKQKLWERAEDFETITSDEYAIHRDKFLRQIKQVLSSLSHAQMKPTHLSKQEWFSLIYEYLNHSRSQKFNCPKLREATNDDLFSVALSEQAVLTDIEIHRDHLKIGDEYFRLLTLKTLPEGYTYASMMDRFLKVPFYFWVSQTLVVHEQKKEIEKLQIQRRLTHSMAAGAKNVSDLESESKLGHIENLTREILDGSEKIISTDLSIVIWGKSIEELDEKSDEVLKSFRHLNQSEGVVETLPCFEAFTKAIPGACTPFRIKKVKTSNAAHLMPLFSSWQGNKRPVCVLPNRDGVLVSIDLFAPEMPNWNGIIFGSSGSGKSFSLLQMILMFYGQKPSPKIIWIDNGSSCKRAVEVLGGEFIDLSIDSSIRLNAFDLGHGETKPSPSKVKLILAVLETILKDDEKSGLPKREKALLEEAIFRCYETIKDRTPRLSDLQCILKRHEVVEMRAYAEILYSWTGTTAYGKMLDGDTNIKLSKNLTAIEIKNLASFPDLQNVFLLLFTDFIRIEASRDISQPFLFVIDEGWKIFQTPCAFSFALEAYRTFRKFNAGIWCISQNYKDFLFNEEISSAILPNTTSFFILKQRRIDWQDFKETLGLNETELEAVKSLQVVKGEHTEMFYMQDEGRAILRVVPDPLSYWICTSDPIDKTRIESALFENPILTQINVLKKLAYTETEAA